MSYILILGILSAVFKIHIDKLSEPKIIERFHKIYYASEPYFHTSYLGFPSGQYPTDNWVMQEIIAEVKPDFIIETGTGAGGTTLFYATVLEKVNENGKVITIDIPPYVPNPKVCEFKLWKERIEFIAGNSISPELVSAIADRVKGGNVLVTLDSDHSKSHVLKELELYSPLVSLNSYIVVQDTHLGGHPCDFPGVKRGNGPWEAVEKFLKTNEDFRIDHSREKYLVTQYPSGFLKRVKEISILAAKN